MHTLMLVTVSIWDNATSEDARGQAHYLLAEDDSFCGEGGRFGLPLADWFVIGGRWSGYLTETVLGEPYREALDAVEREFPRTFPRTAEYHQRLNRLWQRFGGTGAHPLTRSGREQYGSEDDAIIVNQALYDHFLRRLQGQGTSLGEDDHPDFADLDDEKVSESFIGHKWLVVIDYHS